MAAKLSLSLEDQVTCPICLEQYQDPRILPCLHTYCKHCLEDMLNKGVRQFSIKCPECREIVKIDDVNSLKVNIWVNKNLTLLELSKADAKQTGSKSGGIICDNCESKLSAEARCLDCEKFFCESCITAHERMSVLTREHQVVTLKEIKEKGIPTRNKPPLCEKHKGEVKKLYCKTCEGLICRDCIIVDHKEHDVCFVDDIVEKRKEEVIRVIEEAQARIVNTECYLTSVQDMQKGLNTNETKIQEKIHEVISSMIEELEKRRIVLLQEAKGATTHELKKLATYEDDATLHMASLKSAIEFAENLVTKGSSSDVMCLSKQVMMRLKELNAKPLNEELPELCKPVLQENRHSLNDHIARVTLATSIFDVPSQHSIIDRVPEKHESSNMTFKSKKEKKRDKMKRRERARSQEKTCILYSDSEG